MPAHVSITMLAQRVGSLRGWRRRLVALAAGAASVLAMAPGFAWPVLWIPLPVLVWLIDGAACAPRDVGPASPQTPLPVGQAGRGVGARRRGRDLPRWNARSPIAAAEGGWWFGVGYFVPGLFWGGQGVLVEAGTVAPRLAFSVHLLP